VGGSGNLWKTNELLARDEGDHPYRSVAAGTTPGVRNCQPKPSASPGSLVMPASVLVIRTAFTPSQGEAHRGCRRGAASPSTARWSARTSSKGSRSLPSTPKPKSCWGPPDRVLLALGRAHGGIRSAGPAPRTPAVIAHRVPKGRDRVIRHARTRYRFLHPLARAEDADGHRLDPRCASPWLGVTADREWSSRPCRSPRGARRYICRAWSATRPVAMSSRSSSASCSLAAATARQTRMRSGSGIR
jgi:hypothetical protein